MARRWRDILAALCVVAALAASAWATPPALEVNGREYYGTVVTDNGEIYAALDVIGPLLLGPQFRLETYDVTLRRCTFTFIPAGASVPQKMEIFGCVKRGAAVYAPLRQLLRQVGGSFQDQGGTLVAVAYPPAANLATTPPPLAPSPPPLAPSPSPRPVSTPAPTPRPGPTPAPTPAGPPPITTPELAMIDVKAANAQAFAGANTIRKIEVYHPVQPDPSDVIPRTDLAGLRVQLQRLAPGDTVTVSMWDSDQAVGTPVFKQQVVRFGAQEMAEKAVFVRLPLAVAPSWHVVRVEVNGREFVDYRFVTY